MCLMPYANNNDADQSAHPRSLISTFVVLCLDSMICILALSKVSRFQLVSVTLLCWGFTAQSTMKSCRTGQLIVALFLGRLRPSKWSTSTKRGGPQH